MIIICRISQTLIFCVVWLCVFSHRGVFRDHSEPAEVSHHQPDTVQNVQEAETTEHGVATDGGRAVACRADENETVQQARLLSG